MKRKLISIMLGLGVALSATAANYATSSFLRPGAVALLIGGGATGSVPKLGV